MSKDRELNNSSEYIRIMSSQGLVEVPEEKDDVKCLHLDISDNKIKTLPERFFNIISLNASNNINFQPLSLCNLYYLRTLSLDFCSIKSFKVIPHFQNLVNLSLIGNDINSFKYFPIFNKLKQFDLRGNNFTFSAESAILAAGSIHIERINDRKITEEEVKTAFKMSPIIGIALRKGMNPQNAQNNAKEAISFLTKDQTATSTLQVINHSGSKIVILPCNAKSVKWFAFGFTLTRQATETTTIIDEGDWTGDWVNLECPTRTLPVTPSIENRIIRCDFSEDSEKGASEVFSAYTEMPINWDGEKPISTQVLTPTISGKVEEGSLVFVNCKEKAKVKWTLDNETVEENSQFIEIPEGSRGKTLKVECSPISSSFPNIEFAPFSYRDIIGEAVPIIENFSITENPISGEPVIIGLKYSPASSTKINVFIEAASDIFSPFRKICEVEKNESDGLYTFIPTKELANNYLRASCEVEDKSFYAYTKTPVKHTELPILEAKICGPCLANHSHVVVFENQEVDKDISWILLSQDGEYTDLECNETVFRPTNDMIGGTLCVHIVPRSTDVAYAESTIESYEVIGQSDRDEHKYDKQAYEDSELSMEESGIWEVTSFDSPKGFIPIAEGFTFKPTFNEVGSYLRFTGQHLDVFFGIVLPTNKLIRSVTIDSNSYSAGSLLSVDVDMYERSQLPYFNINWIRCQVGGDDDVVVQDGGTEYSITNDDVGSKVKARVVIESEEEEEINESNLTPMIKQGMFDSSIFTSDPIAEHTLSLNTKRGKIKWFREKIEEQKNTYEMLPTTDRELYLVLSDVQRKIRCHVITKKTVYTEVIGPVQPVNIYAGDLLSVDQIFRPHKKRNLFKWVNENNEILSVSDQYIPNKSEIGAYIRVINYARGTENGDDEEDSETVELGPVLARKVDIEIVQTEDWSLKISGESITDNVGEFFWRIWRNGYSDGIDNNNSQTLVMLPEMIGSEIDGGWRMYETDDIKWSNNKVIVERALPQPEAELIEDGTSVVGSVLIAKAKKNPNYKLVYNWKRWDGSKFIIINKANKKRYTVTEDDCDCYVCCDLRYLDRNDGFSGPPFTIRTSGVIPPAMYLTIEGRPVIGSTLIATSNDDFAHQCQLTWQRCRGDEGWVAISKKRSYVLKEDDFDCVIRVIGIHGKVQRYSSEIGPIEEASFSEDNENENSGKEEYNYENEIKFIGKDQFDDKISVQISRSGFTVSRKSFKKTFSWAKGNITPTVTSRRKVDISFNGSTTTVLLTNPPEGMNIKEYRNFIIGAVTKFASK